MRTVPLFPPAPGSGGLRRLSNGLIRGITDLGVAEKIHAVVALFVVFTTLLLVMSIQSLRLQNAYRSDLATSAAAAINIERATGLIYAVVMESRGIYMSTDRASAARFGDEVLRRNRELAKVMGEWESAVRLDDAAQFAIFKKRIMQFIDFRRELVRRAIEISPAAGREWGYNPENLANRTALTEDLAALARIYSERTAQARDLGDLTRLAAWYLGLLGLAALALAALSVVVMRRFVTKPLAEITAATGQIAEGNLALDIPYLDRKDEIGQLAHAVQNFREAVRRNHDLEQLEMGTAKERDVATGQRDQINDRYLAAKWQLSAAINSMPQGVVMMDATAKVVVINQQFREIYGLPPEIKAGSSLKDIVQHRAKKGLLAGSVADYLAVILARIAKRQPSTSEVELTDGRLIHISEQPMAGGGWVATHEDLSERRRRERILERTERLLVTVIENVPTAIVARDVATMRYIFVNSSAEKLFGLPRGAIIGKHARDLFSAETAEMIEQQDQKIVAGHHLDVLVHTVDTPNNSRRTIAVRRLPLDETDGDSRVFITMIEDRTEEMRQASG
jgi:PAS domain S-box-containing protein